jgi:hypothetical protein
MEIMTPPPHGSNFMPSCVLITGSTVRTPPPAKPDTGTEARVNTKGQWTTTVVGELLFFSYLNPKYNNPSARVFCIRSAVYPPPQTEIGKSI